MADKGQGGNLKSEAKFLLLQLGVSSIYSNQGFGQDKFGVKINIIEFYAVFAVVRIKDLTFQDILACKIQLRESGGGGQLWDNFMVP